MESIRSFKNLNKNDVSIAGGKGASLGEMTNVGIPVPPGFVILSNAFERFIEETDLNVEIDSILHKVNHKEIHTVDKASEEIKALILGADMPKDISQEIKQAFKQLKSKYVAVRSSATAEDSSSAAWAGQLESYLNTTEKDLLDKVKHCWASLFTPRAIFYRFEKGLHKTKISVAVVIQKMVESEVSGIAFSVHPVTEDHNQLIIEAGFGLGEAIVSGQIIPDSYVVEKNPRNILDINISTQARGLCRVEAGGNKWKSIPEPKASSQVLTKDQILELSEIILGIEKHYGFPCDIEWAYEKGKFYIVQSRPITTLSNRPFKREFQKFFAREISLVVMEYWHRGEYKELYKILNRATHFNPLFIRNENGLADVYYDMNNPDTALQPLFDYFKKNPNKFDLFVKEFEVKQKEISKLLDNFETRSFSKLFNAIAEAWGYLPIWTQFGSADKKDIAPDMIEISYKLRDQFQDIEYKAGEVLLSSIKTKYPKLKEYADMISAQEIINNKTPDLEELKQREKGFIFFEEQLLTKISKEEFVKKYQVVLVDDLATIGEDNLNNKSVADNEDVILVRGKTAYPGFVKGRVRIIMLKSQLDTIQDGEILVTNMTTPEFVPALKKVVAFITDEGGITSHAAIVAREMRKPCIIGTKNATKKLKDGDLVEVDANNGIVKILRSRSVMALDAGLKSVAVKYIKEFARNYSLFHVVAFVEFNKRPTPEFNIIIDTGHPLFVHTGGSLANIYYPEGELRKIFDQFGKVIMANTGYLDGVIAKFFKVIDEIRPYFEKKKSVKNLEELKYLYELFMDFGYGEALVWVAPLVESLPDETKAKALSVREQTQDLTSLRDEAFDYNLCKLFPELGELTHFVLPKSVFSGKTVGELLREAKRYQKGFIYFNGNIYTGRQDKILKKLNIELESDKPTEKIYSISGQSASSGLARGKVKIVLTNKDLAKILDGDILVSPMTRPDFLPAMKKAAAFVTDEGGVTCHAAIVSREMSKPCIIGTKVATQVLKDGDSVEVDANIGVVKILK